MKPHGYWTEERILDEISKIDKYISVPEIRRKNSSLYYAITKYKLFDKVYSILGRTGNRYNKCIYSYEFPDNTVYVGLTYNIEERQKNRDS